MYVLCAQNDDFFACGGLPRTNDILLWENQFCPIRHALRSKFALRHALHRHALPEKAGETMLGQF